ncbi:MAG: FAD-binding oxidoreductase [Gemmatimonadaceae bacterium]
MRSDAEIAEVIRDAVDAGDSLRLVGRGTWLDAGSPVTATRRLVLADDSGVVAYTPGDLTITVRAGSTIGEISDTLRSHDQWLALDPAGGPDGSIGATVATCSYGPSAALFGTPRDQVLGMTVVTGSGDVIKPGGRVVKNVAGFDLTRLMIGAWGTLGVITQVTLRVRSRGMTIGSMEHMRRTVASEYGFRRPLIVHPALSRALKLRFDPQNVLNPGILGEEI